MAAETVFEPGASVRADDRDIGTVEALEGQTSDSSDESGYLIVRAADGNARYRIPRSFVRRVRRRNGHVVVHMDLRDQPLSNYRVQQERVVSGPSISSAPEGRVWEPHDGEETLRVPLATEELTVHAQPFTAGTVFLHKGVESFEHHLSLPVRQEHVVMERLTPDQYNPDAPRDPDEIVIPIMEERLVVQKQMVVREYILVRKEKMEQQQETTATLQREFLDVSQLYPDGTPAGPSLHYAASQPQTSGDAPPQTP